jgi:hypothetical protein
MEAMEARVAREGGKEVAQAATGCHRLEEKRRDVGAPGTW